MAAQNWAARCRGVRRTASSATPRCAPTVTPEAARTTSPTSPLPDDHGMLKVWMSHGDKVTAAATGLQIDVLSTPSCPIAGMADESRGYYALQFHPEVTHTVQGMADARRASCANIAGCAGPTGSWAITSTKRWPAFKRAGRRRGSDPRPVGRRRFSSVAAALIHRAIGDQLTCVFVDHGLLRLNEGDDGDGHVRGSSCTPR